MPPNKPFPKNKKLLLLKLEYVALALTTRRIREKNTKKYRKTKFFHKNKLLIG